VTSHVANVAVQLKIRHTTLAILHSMHETGVERQLTLDTKEEEAILRSIYKPGHYPLSIVLYDDNTSKMMHKTDEEAILLNLVTLPTTSLSEELMDNIV